VTLTPGDRIGPYEILSSLGTGGMGAVYRARDTKLNRDVALKVLLPEVANDPERLARFRREAQVLASLNHPHIGTIHGLEEGPAEQAGTIALVLELVEGPTLADRIAQGPLPLDEALPIAKQIAEALEAAHEAGVIHRDLKPANIKVRDDGTVKVLDFGLAKALETRPEGRAYAFQSPASNLSLSPTITSPAHTDAGIILGTATYMAPEQAKGRPVDKRADIWAFGCVLYEMTTGRRLFVGEDVTDILASVVKVDADVSLAPPEMQRLLKKCLEKDPKKRLRDIADWSLLVDDSPANRAAQVATAPARSRSWPIVAATSMLVAAAAVVAAVWWAGREPASPPTTVVRMVIPAGLEFVPQALFAFSPDGSRLVFGARRGNNVAGGGQLFVWSRDSLEAHPIPGTEGARAPFWSPDGRSLAFRLGLDIRRVDIAAGTTETVVSGGVAVDGGDWSREGVMLFGNSAGGISRVPAKGGEPVAVTSANARADVHQEAPVFLPDGRHFLYMRHAIGAEGTGVYLGSIDVAPADQSATPLLLADDGPKFVSGADERSGHVLFQRRGTLFAQALDLQALQLRGEAIPVATGVAGGDVNNHMSASANGDLLAYRPRTAGSQTLRKLVWVDRNGRQEPLPLEPGGYEDPMVSPDGSRIALALTAGGDAPRDIWIWHVARQTLSRLTFEAISEFAPLWTRDGARVVFNQGANGLFSKAADGTGSAERVGTPGGAAFGWGADDRLITASPGRGDIGVVEPNGERRVLLGGNFTESVPAMSPDGRWMAYESDESGQLEIYVRPYPNVEQGKWLISSGGGIRPRWSPTGTDVFYIGPSQMMAVRVNTRSGFTPDRPVPLFAIQPYVILVRPRSYDVSADGKRLLMLVETGGAREDAERADLVFIQNWRPPQPR